MAITVMAVTILFFATIWLNEIHFWANPNPELGLHGVLDFAGKFHDVVAIPAAVMNEDEGLFVINSNVFVAPAFPTGSWACRRASLLDEPTGGDFHLAIGFVVMWNVWKFFLQSCKLRRLNDGILEKTARAANLLYIRQFGVADGANGIVELLQGRVYDAVLLQIGFNVAVIEVEWCVFFQQEVHRSDDELVFQLVFENTFAVAETTFFFAENLGFSRFQFKGFALQETVFQLHTVCTNVLHWCCSHFSGNVRQIFQTIPTFTDRKLHEIRPILARLGVDNNLVFIFSKDFNPFRVDEYDQTVKNIVLKQNIVAAAEDEVLFLLEDIA